MFVGLRFLGGLLLPRHTCRTERHSAFSQGISSRVHESCTIGALGDQRQTGIPGGIAVYGWHGCPLKCWIQTHRLDEPASSDIAPYWVGITLSLALTCVGQLLAQDFGLFPWAGMSHYMCSNTQVTRLHQRKMNRDEEVIRIKNIDTPKSPTPQGLQGHPSQRGKHSR